MRERERSRENHGYVLPSKRQSENKERLIATRNWAHLITEAEINP